MKILVSISIFILISFQYAKGNPVDISQNINLVRFCTTENALFHSIDKLQVYNGHFFWPVEHLPPIYRYQNHLSEMENHQLEIELRQKVLNWAKNKDKCFEHVSRKDAFTQATVTRKIASTEKADIQTDEIYTLELWEAEKVQNKELIYFVEIK